LTSVGGRLVVVPPRRCHDGDPADSDVAQQLSHAKAGIAVVVLA
jgi:hypothetical protein